MRFIAIVHPPDLPKRWNKIYSGRVSELKKQATEELAAAYVRGKGGWKALKGWLARTSDHKCWYCEAKSPRSPFDVDHFRPKLEITIDREKLTDHVGYYWLAYEWWNFRLSCQRCNRPETDDGGKLRGKSNEFPLRDEAVRCGAAGAPLSDEEPRLLDPCVKEDCELLAHGIDGEVRPAALEGTWEFDRANYTIETLGLNAYNSPEGRRSSWQPISTLINLLDETEDQRAIEVVRKHLSGAQEYSSFFRSVIGTHREKKWIDDLL